RHARMCLIVRPCKIHVNRFANVHPESNKCHSEESRFKRNSYNYMPKHDFQMSAISDQLSEKNI
ncbi:MAG: hypothetical protein ACERKR_09125, partial [Deltaproteobacteria bacterium]